jgi:RND family efflux transporter MFP subunit
VKLPKLAIVLILAALAAAVGAYIWYRAAPAVETATAVRGPAIRAVYATGVVEPVEWAKVSPLVRGRIIETCGCEGANVAAGDVLARLDDREARATLAEQEARAVFALQEVERYRALAETRAATPQTLQRVLSELAQARASVIAARERLGQLTVHAPISGTVLRRDGEVGEVVGTEDILFWVGKPKPIWITADIDEEDIPLVARGQRALIKADAFPGRALEAQVLRITPKAIR